MPWFTLSFLPHVMRSFEYRTASLMQNCAAPSDDAAWRMRFSCTKVCATSRPRPSSPSMVEAGTLTLVSDPSAWSDGMLKVHHMCSTLKPGAWRKSCSGKNLKIPIKTWCYWFVRAGICGSSPKPCAMPAILGEKSA